MTDGEQLDAAVEQGQGGAEQAAGAITGDEQTKGKGMLHEAEGKLREAAGKIKDAVHDVTHRGDAKH